MGGLDAFAPAKVNLTLHVRGRRTDGYHDLESLVVFASVGDRLALDPGPALSLDVAGPSASASGPIHDNLVLTAAYALAAHVPGLAAGRFRLEKHLPVAAGLGGGSADAAAALRLLARLNGLRLDDQRLLAAAAETGADVSVCLDTRPAMMRGVGDEIVRLPSLPNLDAVLVNPGVPVATAHVFAGLGLARGQRLDATSHPDIAACRDAADFTARLAAARNDLSAAARRLAPQIGDAETALAAHGAALTRMSGSGATIFGLFATPADAARAAAAIESLFPRWWVRAVRLGGA